MIDFITTASFDRDVKRAAKSHRSIIADLDVAKSALLSPFHLGIIPVSPQRCVLMHDRCDYKVYKIRHFAYASLKGKGGNSGYRLIYIYAQK